MLAQPAASKPAMRTLRLRLPEMSSLPTLNLLSIDLTPGGVSCVSCLACVVCVVCVSCVCVWASVCNWYQVAADTPALGTC